MNDLHPSCPPVPARRPRGWTAAPVYPHARRLGSPRLRAWRRGRLLALSDLVLAELPSGDGEGWTWHVSVSVDGGRRRPADSEMARVRVAFGMPLGGADEDNHHPGVARHLFMPVDPEHRRACHCKEDEVQMREADGYVWSNPVDACRECDLALLTGRACRTHGRRP